MTIIVLLEFKQLLRPYFYYSKLFYSTEIKEFLSADLSSEHLQSINEKKRKDMLRLIDSLLASVYSVNPSLRPRMNTPGQSEQPKQMLSKPPLKAPVPSVPRVLQDEGEDDPQEEYLPMGPGSPEIEPEDYEAPGDVIMPDGMPRGNEGQFQQEELYEELPAEDGGQNDEPEEYEDPAASGSAINLNQVPLPPKPTARAAANGFEEPGYQPTGKPAEESDGLANFEPWQYAKTMRDKKISTSDLKKADCKGMLEKLGGRGHNTWQKRYCILDTSLLYFFKDEKSKNFNNFIEAFAYDVAEAPDKTREKKRQFCFMLTCRQSEKDYYFRTTSSEDRERWITALKNCVPSNTPSTQGPGSMNTMKKPGKINNVEPAVEDFQCECYEDIPARNDQIQSEGESDEEKFEHLQPKRVGPPVVPKMPPPPPPAETYDQDQLYDEHPVEDEPEEEYLACESEMQQDIIAAASPLEIVVDTSQIYEAADSEVDLEKVYVSLYDFNAEEADEMSLQRGDLVCVTDNSSSPNWWLAELMTPDIMKTNKKGLCPANFLTLAFEQL